MNLWSEFFPIPPEAGAQKTMANNWRSLVENRLFSGKWTFPFCKYFARVGFNGTYQTTRASSYYRENQRWTQLPYLLLSMLRQSNYEEVDPVLGLYETLKSAMLKMISYVHQTVLELRKVGTKRAGDEASTLGFEKPIMDLNPSIEA